MKAMLVPLLAGALALAAPALHAAEAEEPASDAAPGTSSTAAPAPVRPDPRKVVARVNGTPIRLSDVRAAVNRLIPLQGYHGNVKKEQLQGLSRQALESEIDNRLELADAEARGIEPNAEDLEVALATVVARYPSEEAFKAQLEKAGFSIADVKQELRRRQRLELVKARVADARREVDEETARRYYDANVAKFREPRRAVVRELLVVVDPTNRTKEAWDAALVKVTDARRRATAGEDFGAIAQQISDAPASEKARGGLIGAVHEGRLPAYLDKAVWKLPAGGISEPIRAFKGVYLVKVDRFMPERVVPFAEAQAKLRGELQRKYASERVTKWVSDLRAKAKIEYLDPYFAPAPAPAPVSVSAQ